MIGTGKFVTTAIITADGRPVEEETSTNLQEIDTVGTLDDSPGGNNSTLDKKVIEWKLTLHQIGMCLINRHICQFNK